jgi:ribosomal protein S27E
MVTIQEGGEPLIVMKTPNITLKSLLLSGALGIATLMTACQTAPPTPLASAVTCNKCKMVWVEHANNPGYAKNPGAYVPVKRKVMVCPDCESSIVTFFKTGKLKHSCTHCGGTLTHCTYH